MTARTWALAVLFAFMPSVAMAEKITMQVSITVIEAASIDKPGPVLVQVEDGITHF